MIDLNILFKDLQKSVIEAGDLALDFFGKPIAIEQKADGSKVSAADLAVNDFLKTTLLDKTPNFAWLSEESPITDDRLSNAYVWIVDPIDGTSSFLDHKPEWTIVVSLIHNHKPILGTVYNPVSQELFTASKGQGARLNDKKITVSATNDLRDAHIITSKSHFNRTFQDQNKQPNKRSWVNSMAYRIVLVANGKADATISLTQKNDWDIAAAHLILEEAGGNISNPQGETIHYNNLHTNHSGIVAASSGLYKQIIEKTSQPS